ncbi:MAG: hypothetical protein JF615_01985 [Asticcacaulis sp.]|nr:hypothetical protein [Asticcacaulis sp.]
MGLKFPFFTKAADAAPDAPAFQADAPIRRASEDLLGRREFAQALGKVLATWRGDFSLVVGLRGGWGEGKSSLKNLALQAAAEQAKRPSVVEFNPWRHGDSAAITNAFYQELAAALGDADKSLAGRQRAWAFQRYARFFTTASGGLKSTGEPIGNAVGWLAGIGFLSAGVGAAHQAAGTRSCRS